MKKIIFVLGVFIAFAAQSQNVGFNNILTTVNVPYDNHEMGTHYAMPLQYVREADVMWSKTIWREINFKEKNNQIFYFPDRRVGQYRNLFAVLNDAVTNGAVLAYSADGDIGEEFDNQLNNTNDLVDINPAFVRKLYVKELWFFDKQRSVLDVRIIGIAPVLTEPTYTETGEVVKVTIKPIFWVKYSDVRYLLASAPVFNPYNERQDLTYDMVFQRRMFSSRVFAVSNPKFLQLTDYTAKEFLLLKGKEVENEIYDFEQSLWEY